MSLLSGLLGRPYSLSEAEKADWENKGYLVLKGLIKPRWIDAYLREIDRLWETRAREDNPLVIDFWEGELFGRRMLFKNAPEGSRKLVCKLNDTHFVSEICRNVCLNERLVPVLRDLIGGDPLAIGTLTFEKGSQQPDHFDTYYMPAPNEGMLVVSSVFLESVGSKQGPVRVYPGSHLIPPYRFSDGNIYEAGKEGEMTEAKAYIDRELSERGIEPEIITGEPGDVLIWHGQAYHGGTEIFDRSLTRKSLVTHYWDVASVESEKAIPFGKGAAYLKREHHATWE